MDYGKCLSCGNSIAQFPLFGGEPYNDRFIIRDYNMVPRIFGCVNDQCNMHPYYKGLELDPEWEGLNEKTINRG